MARLPPSQGWIPRLERKLELAADGAHADFRCFFSAEPINGAPQVRGMHRWGLGEWMDDDAAASSLKVADLEWGDCWPRFGFLET